MGIYIHIYVCIKYILYIHNGVKMTDNVSFWFLLIYHCRHCNICSNHTIGIRLITLDIILHVPKCMSQHKANERIVITWTANCLSFRVQIQLSEPSWIWALCVSRVTYNKLLYMYMYMSICLSIYLSIYLYIYIYIYILCMLYVTCTINIYLLYIL